MDEYHAQDEHQGQMEMNVFDQRDQNMNPGIPIGGQQQNKFLFDQESSDNSNRNYHYQNPQYQGQLPHALDSPFVDTPQNRFNQYGGQPYSAAFMNVLPNPNVNIYPNQQPPFYPFAQTPIPHNLNSELPPGFMDAVPDFSMPKKDSPTKVQDFKTSTITAKPANSQIIKPKLELEPELVKSEIVSKIMGRGIGKSTENSPGLDKSEPVSKTYKSEIAATIKPISTGSKVQSEISKSNQKRADLN